MSYAAYKRVLGPVVEALYRPEVRGAEHVPLSGPLVVAANHESILDPFLLGMAVPRPIRWLAKAELWQIPLVGDLLEAGGVIPLRRGGSDVAAIGAAVDALEAGEAVGIFPRGRVRSEGPWLRGGARMALVTGAPLLPVRLVDTAKALAPGTVGFPRLAALIGEPLRVERGKPTIARARELTHALQAAVETLGT
jgi:1-acyl-sn-glycerol-3-phosphate acyltransferase